MTLNEGQKADVVKEPSQGSPRPALKAVGGIQMDMGEEVRTAPVDPAFRDEGTREEAPLVPCEHVNDFINDFLGDMRNNHFGVGVEDKGEPNIGTWVPS